MSTAIKSDTNEIIDTYHKKNTRILIVNNIVGGLSGIGIATLLYFGRQPLSAFFMSSETSSDIKTTAETFLWVNALSLAPDAIRIICLGALRGWKSMISPTITCLVTMTVVGVPAGYVMSTEEDDWSYMFVVRDVVIALSSGILMWQVKRKIQESLNQFYMCRGQDILPSSQKNIQTNSALTYHFDEKMKRANCQEVINSDKKHELTKPDDLRDENPTTPLLERKSKQNKRWCTIV